MWLGDGNRCGREWDGRERDGREWDGMEAWLAGWLAGFKTS